MCLMSCLTEVQPLVMVKSKFVVDPKSKSIFLLFSRKVENKSKSTESKFSEILSAIFESFLNLCP